MVPDDTDDRGADDDTGTDDVDEDDGESVQVDVETSEEGREDFTTRSVEGVDQRIVDVLSWILDTETRAKIYVYLLANPGSTSEEVAKGTGLYPSTVREALAELHDEERVTRDKRASEGAGNNPYEYTAIQPSELVGGVVDQFQQELNTVFNLDHILARGDDEELPADVEPVTITVDDADASSNVGASGTDDATDGPVADADDREVDANGEETDDAGDADDEDDADPSA